MSPPTQVYGDLLHPVGRTYPRTAVWLGRLRCSRQNMGASDRGNCPLGIPIPPDRVRSGGSQVSLPTKYFPSPHTAANRGDSGVSA